MRKIGLAPALVRGLVLVALLFAPSSWPLTALADAVDLCGNLVVDEGEDCDDGGVCVGGENAGTSCRAETDCHGSGICTGPGSLASSCTRDTDCGTSGHCRHCLPFGGDGCAANCTEEAVVASDLITGQVDLSVGQIASGTSGISLVLPDEVSFLNLPIPIQGRIQLVVGREREGEAPLVLREDGLEIPAIELTGLGVCVCVREIAPKTCGGIAFETDGETRATDCSSDENVCAELGEPPCIAVNGRGNAMAGTVGCNGRSPIRFADTLDREFDSLGTLTAGDGGAGSISGFVGLRLEVSNGRCVGARPENGPDQAFCTADDPVGGTDAPIPMVSFATTDVACGTVYGGPQGLFGPRCVTGDPTTCTSSGAPADRTCFAQAVPRANVPTLGDIIALNQLCFDFSVAQPPTPTPTATPTPSPSPTPTMAPCVGDCRGDGAVTVDEILRGVAIALGNLSIDSCPAIDSDGNLAATVDEIVRAVNLALNGC